MFNPNTNEQMMQSVKADLEFLGFIVADCLHIKSVDMYSCTIGNESIQFAHLTFFSQRITIRANGKTYKPIEYKGSLEKLSEDVCVKVVKLALKKAM